MIKQSNKSIVNATLIQGWIRIGRQAPVFSIRRGGGHFLKHKFTKMYLCVDNNRFLSDL